MIGMRMTVKTEHQLQDGGALEYVYHDRTEWRYAGFVGKRYGSKGCEQPIAVATASMVTLLSPRMMSSTRCDVAGVAISTGRPTRCSSSILVRPSENFCTQLWTAWRVRQCSRYMGSISLWISFAATPFCPQKPHGLLVVTGNVHRTWAAFLYGYPLLPYLFAHKNRTTPCCSIVVHVFKGAAIL